MRTLNEMTGANLQKIILWFTIFCLSQLCATNQSFGDKETQAAFLGKKNILVLNSYHQGYEWTDDIMHGLRDRLAKSNLTIDLYVEYLDTKRFPDRTYWQPLFNSLSTKYKNIPFSLIITSDNNALEFLFQYRDRFYSETPVVFCGLNNFTPEMIGNQKRVTGIAESTDLKQTIDLSLYLHRNIKKLIFIASSARSSVLNLAQLEELRPILESHLAIEVWKDQTIEENEKRVQQLKANSLIFILGRSRNLKGEYLNTIQMGQRLSAASSVPIYSLWDFYLGTGIVGGKLVNGRDQGRVAGDLALKVLNGIPVSKIPVITEPHTSYMFDYLQLKHFNISMDLLPNNSIVINKPYSFYEEHKKFVWTTFFVFLMLTAWIIILSLNIRRRRRAEKELQKHRDHLQELVEERTVELTDSNRALTDSEERFRSLSDAAFEGIVFTEKGIIVEINNTCCEMFGYRPSEVIGKVAIDFISPEEREDVESKALSNYNQPYETRGVRKDGSTFPIEIHAKMFSYKGREVRVSAIRDLTKQKKVEEEIKTLRGILPICSFCKKIRDDKGYWEKVEVYIHKYSQADFSHGVCPECMKKHYPEEYQSFLDEDK